MRSIYLIGSLRNRSVIKLGNNLRAAGYDAFDSWIAAGPEADDFWQDYAKQRGLSYQEALNDYSAQHVFEFDKHHLDRCDGSILVMPAGKSAHIELGYTVGKDKPAWVLFDKEPERYDVMYNFTNGVFFEEEKLVSAISEYFNKATTSESVREQGSDKRAILRPKFGGV